MTGFGKFNRFLVCFYCGRKTTTKYDRGMRSFDCKNCLATNYLDAVRQCDPILTRGRPV